MRIKRNNILKALACGLLLVGLAACSESPIETLSNGAFNGKPQIVLTFVTPNDNASTRADGMGTRSAEGDPDGYEAGIEYENTVNIDAEDYKIYFFTYSSGDEKGGTLIAEFTPESITSSSTSTTTRYHMTGDVPDALMEVNDFRIVMLANWGSYPSVTAGTTTIDDLCEGDNTTFNASNKFTLSASNLIPFYGVQEYTNVRFSLGTTTNLAKPISLLRAVAKVEVILTADSDYDEFDAVSIVNYNSTGYCAPAGVYTADDYDTSASKSPGTSDWPDEWVANLHLVNNANDTGSKTQAFTKVSGATQDTWRIYVPEYDNMDTDYSYISVTIDGETYEVYFADYNDGSTNNTDTSNRLNLKRNNLYRYYVTLKNRELRVFVETWENVFDNEWKFGEYSHLIYSESDPNNFTDDNGYIYASLVEEGDEESEANPTVYLQRVDDSDVGSQGFVYIPETVTYLGYTYTVVGIGSFCFDADTDITFIDIPATVTYIESDAFNGDQNLEGIVVHCETPPTCAEDAFGNDDLSSIALYVPIGSVEAYKAADVWKNFTNITGVDFSGN